MPPKRRSRDLERDSFRDIWQRSEERGRQREQDQARPVQFAQQAQSGTSTRAAGFELLLHSARQFGFTHPRNGGFLMLPLEFDAIVALETKAVTQIVLEIMRQTIGWQDSEGRYGRREWARLGHRHFEKRGILRAQVHTGLKRALQQGYIVRRPASSKDGFEYAIRWADDSGDDVPQDVR